MALAQRLFFDRAVMDARPIERSIADFYRLIASGVLILVFPCVRTRICPAAAQIVMPLMVSRLSLDEMRAVLP